jgi:ADP-ribose pyrophosphatase
MNTLPRPISAQPLPKNATKVFTGVIFDVYQWPQMLFDGSTKTFEKLKRPDTVVVIPVTEEGEIIMTHQEQSGKAPFQSFAGGQVEEGEDILAAAARELREETGYEAAEYVLLDAVQPSSKIEWAVYTFVARGCRKVDIQHLDAGEKVAMELISFDQFVQVVSAEDFHEVDLVIRVLHAKLDPFKMTALKSIILGHA